MITADTLKLLTNFGPTALAQTLGHSGYTGAVFKTAKFLGLTNGNQFCYAVTFPDESGTGVETGKVFLTYDPVKNQVIADY